MGAPAKSPHGSAEVTAAGATDAALPAGPSPDRSEGAVSFGGLRSNRFPTAPAAAGREDDEEGEGEQELPLPSGV